MRKALVIGLNNYTSAPLNGCVNDAVEVGNVLEKNGDGSPNFSVMLLTDPPQKITKPVIREAVEKLFMGQSDVSLLYFSGHGLIKSTGGYIVTPDYQRYDEGISMDEILTLANKSQARDKVVILDCCHSGAFGSPSLNNSSVTQLSEGLSVLTACRNTESAMEAGGSGVFTSLLVDALQGGASDLRGFITPGSLYSYVDQALGPWEQRPVFKTNVTRFSPLRRINPPISMETIRNIVIYFKSPEEEYKLDPSYEFTSEQPNEQNVKIFKDLQKFESVGLIKPVDEEHMYFAAINFKACRLTALGYQYWRLVNEKKI